MVPTGSIAFVKILAASIAMGVVASVGIGWLTTVLPGSGTIVKALRVALSIGAAVVVLVGAARVLRIAEFDDAFSRVLRRLRPAA